MRIALFEDNLSLARGILTALQDQWHMVDHLDDGEDGETFLRQERCDMAIIDVNLPRLSGLDLVRRMRVRGSATPVLILTAMGKTSDRV